MSKEKTVYAFILCHHHILRSSPNQQRANFLSQKMLFHHHLLFHPISIANNRVHSHTPSLEPIVFFLLRIININQLQSKQTVYPLILPHYHRLHSSPHHHRNSNLLFKKGYFIISGYNNPPEEPILLFIPTPYHQSLLSYFCW